MKKLQVLLACSLLFTFSSCQKNSTVAWENVKTAGRYLNKSIDSLIGKEIDSKLITEEDEFIGPDDDDFIPLSDLDLKTQFTTTDAAIAQPKKSIGEQGSGIPKMAKFASPDGKLTTVFKTIHFPTDDHVIREREDLIVISKIANFLKKNPDYYLITEGHTDERASSAYNMALGTRRANHVRVLLIKQGVDFNKIYTVSHGKEKPLASGHTKEDWLQNRRTEFKIFKKK
jgi:peptidoglycan-associated lipoprotein